MDDLYFGAGKTELRLVYRPKFQAPAGPINGI